MHRRLILRLLLVCVALAPFGFALANHLDGASSTLLRMLGGWFHLQCHQLPSRAFVLWGSPLPVCARCLGIYVGIGAAALLAWPSSRSRWSLTDRQRRVWIVGALAIMAVDVLSGAWSGWHEGREVRFVTGLLVAYPIVLGLVLRKAGGSG